MVNVTMIACKVSKMTTHCADTEHMREESERGIRKWEEMWFKTRAEDGEGAAVTCDQILYKRPQGAPCGRLYSIWCDGRLFLRRAAATGNTLSPTVDKWVGPIYVERPETAMRQNVNST